MQAFGDDGIDSGTIVVAARKESGTGRGATRLREWKSVKRTPPAANLSRTGVLTGPIATEVPVAQVVNEQGDDIRTLVLGKSRTKQKEEERMGKLSFT